ncbi:VanZ family protein [Galactobacter caseinivorans]|uniref:VanZ family protein n=1 Tax=Galactobacter caseinivorans TaxID=2676123 RepID=A0A496PG68_9MICC|nr:VanZ family protein [Galactobacter caseinivorans]RKW69470.1 hypothetical protein DWQ67_13035 [Galactobacter caseinivorans]
MNTSAVLYPGLVAVLFGGLSILLGGVFLLALQYRRFGRLTWGRTLAGAATIVYLIAVGTFTQLPLPASRRESCVAPAGGLSLNPMGPVNDLRYAMRDGFVSGLHELAFWQLALNVLLFIPFGILAVRLLGIHPVGAVALGYLASLSIEATQYTGIFGLYCRYRVADIGDLTTNTLGTLVGVLLALTPLFKWIKTPGQLTATATRRPLSRGRRLWGMVFDLAFVGAAGVAAAVIVELVRAEGHRMGLPAGAATWAAWLGWLLPLAVTLLPVLGPRRASWGQRCVWLDVARQDGRRAPLIWALVRALFGGAGYTLWLLSSELVPGAPEWLGTVAGLWVLAAGIGLLFDPAARGLAARATGLTFAPRSSRDSPAPR